MSIPQLIITLAPDGTLVAELPGPNGARRQVHLQPGHEAETLRTILQGQLASRIDIGLDGAPTQAQVRHWERHSEGWGDPSCKFCLAEGRFESHGSRKPRLRREITRLGSGTDTVIVRKVPMKGRRKLDSHDKSMEDLGI